MMLSLLVMCYVTLPLFRWGPNSIFRRHRICSLSRILSWSSKLMTTCPCRKRMEISVSVHFSIQDNLIARFVLEKKTENIQDKILVSWCKKIHIPCIKIAPSIWIWHLIILCVRSGVQLFNEKNRPLHQIYFIMHNTTLT